MSSFMGFHTSERTNWKAMVEWWGPLKGFLIGDELHARELSYKTWGLWFGGLCDGRNVLPGRRVVDLFGETIRAYRLARNLDCVWQCCPVMQILKDLGVRTMKLMTNNPSKYLGLTGYGLSVSRRVPILSPLTKENTRYLETKRAKMGHVYGSDLAGFMMNSVQEDEPDSPPNPPT